MKRILTAVCLTTALAFAAHAGDSGTNTERQIKAGASKGQSATMKELLAKYDTNKDGKLEKNERAKMSAADKAKLEELRAAHQHKDTSK
jgi:hypothetical protein